MMLKHAKKEKKRENELYEIVNFAFLEMAA